MVPNLLPHTFRVNESVVFHFTGDIKTTRIAQGCPNVARHFHLANRLTEALEIALREGKIRWNNEFTEINYNPDFQLD